MRPAPQEPVSVLVDFSVPAPVTALTLLRLGPGRALLLGAFAPGSITRAARRTARLKARIEASPAPATEARAARRAETTTTRRRPTRTRRTRRTKTTARARRSSRTTGTRTRRPGAGRARRAESRRTRRPRRTAAYGTRSRRFGLSLFDDDRPPLHQPPRQLLDRRLGALVGRGFHEGKPAGPTCVAVQRDTNAPNFYSLAGERLTKLLLVDVVREIPDEKTSTHPASFLRTPSLGQIMSLAD